MHSNKIYFAVLAIAVISVSATAVIASNVSQFTQQINPGTLATDIRNASRATVASPTVAMSSRTFSFDCQSGGSASTGTFGSDSQRIYVDNPGAAGNGWTLAIAADVATTTWATSTKKFDFNDPTSSGCGDGADAEDTVGGQMTVDASGGVLTADCASCNTNNITKGGSASFSEGATDSITLLTGAANSDDIGRWYLTDASLSQSIPGEASPDNYSINLTLTVTAS